MRNPKVRIIHRRRAHYRRPRRDIDRLREFVFERMHERIGNGNVKSLRQLRTQIQKFTEDAEFWKGLADLYNVMKRVQGICL